MSTTPAIPLPAAHALRKLGRELALARRKRRISTADMAARLFVSRDTLWRLERGDPTVSIGTLATAVFVLQLHERLANLAAPASRSASGEWRSPKGRIGNPVSVANAKRRSVASQKSGTEYRNRSLNDAARSRNRP